MHFPVYLAAGPFRLHPHMAFEVIALPLATAGVVTTGALMAIGWITKWNRTLAGEALNLRLLWIGLALMVGGFVAMLVCIANLTTDFT